MESERSSIHGLDLCHMTPSKYLINPDIIYTTLCKMQQIYYTHNVVQMQLLSYIHNTVY